MELLFERFLSEVRGEWPDIDLDLPSETDREKAVQYVYERMASSARQCAPTSSLIGDVPPPARSGKLWASMQTCRHDSHGWSVSGANACFRSETPRRHGSERRSGESTRGDHPGHQLLCPVRLPRATAPASRSLLTLRPGWSSTICRCLPPPFLITSRWVSMVPRCWLRTRSVTVYDQTGGRDPLGLELHPGDERERQLLAPSRIVLCSRATGCNTLGPNLHRRDALWQVERAVRQSGPLFAGTSQEEDCSSPLEAMSPTERVVADYSGTGVTVGRHPMAHCRSELRKMEVFPASYLRSTRHGTTAGIPGCVTARQRPGTACGFIFLSLEDETGIANAIIDPDLYQQNRNLVTYGKILLIEGMLQNIDKVVHVRMQRVSEMTIDAQLGLKSHDFH